MPAKKQAPAPPAPKRSGSDEDHLVCAFRLPRALADDLKIVSVLSGQKQLAVVIAALETHVESLKKEIGLDKADRKSVV